MAKAFHDEEQKWQRTRMTSQTMAKGKECPTDARPTTQDANKTVTTISEGYATYESKRQQKLTARQVMSIIQYGIVADPKYLGWPEYPITFSRAD